MSFKLHQRKKSVGNESIVTISSSVADDFISYSMISNQSMIEESLKINPNNVHIDGSKAIQVGDRIYNFYTPPSTDQQAFDFNEALDFSPSNNDVHKNHLSSYCDRFSRKYLIIFIASVFVIAIWIAVMIIILNNTKNNNKLAKFTTESSLHNATDKPEMKTTTSLNFDVSTESSTVSTTTLNPLIISNGVKLFSRHHWNANSSLDEIRKLKLPIKRIIITHTADENDNCLDEFDCKARVKTIQILNAVDISYNFLIGGDGNVYEGRGFQFEGEHTENINTTSFNDIGICVAFIGNFSLYEISQVQKKAYESFVEYFLNEGSISMEFKLFFHDQLAKPKVPADALYEMIRTWENFHEVSKVFRRDEWKAYERCRPSKKLELPIRHILFDNIDGNCSNFKTCSERIRTSQYGAQLRCVYNDIYYGFVFGTNGLVFEGRGFDVTGENLKNYDDLSLGIAFIGKFNSISPTETLVKLLFKFLDDAVALGKISPEFKVHARADFAQFYDGPGSEFRKVMETWPQFSKTWDD